MGGQVQKKRQRANEVKNEGRKRLLPLAEIAFCIDGFRQS